MSDGKTRRYMNEREWQCFEDGVKYERERVIKLLEQTESPSRLWGGIAWSIALIKGEK